MQNLPTGLKDTIQTMRTINIKRLVHETDQTYQWFANNVNYNGSNIPRVLSNVPTIRNSRKYTNESLTARRDQTPQNKAYMMYSDTKTA